MIAKDQAKVFASIACVCIALFLTILSYTSVIQLENIRNLAYIPDLSNAKSTLLSPLQGQTPGHGKENLLVVAGARRYYFDLIRVNVHNHFATGWECMVYIYDEDIPAEEMESLKEVCTVQLLPGHLWGDYLYLVSPPYVEKYDHVAVLLDDIFLPTIGPKKVDFPELMNRMKRHNLTIAAPAIDGAHRLSNRPRESCMFQVWDLEIFMHIFTKEAWQCAWSMLKHENHSGWCIDLCLHKMCPAHNQAVDHTMVAYHIPGRQPDFNTTDYDASQPLFCNHTLRERVGEPNATMSYSGDLQLCADNNCVTPVYDMTPLFCTGGLDISKIPAVSGP